MSTDPLKSFLLERAYDDPAVGDAIRDIVVAWPNPFGDWNAAQTEAAAAMKRMVLLRLAEMFNAHPDYRPEWAPALPRE